MSQRAPLLTNQTLRRRLRPLYVTSFCLGLGFSYAVFFPFLTEIGLSKTEMTIAVMVGSLGMLLTEIPLGIVADRYSRTFVLKLAAACMCGMSLLFGMAHAPWQIYVGEAVAAVFLAATSGLFDSLVYDTLLETQGNRKGFERYFGRVQAWKGVAWALSSLAGAILATQFGMRPVFYLTAASGVLAWVVAWFVREPSVHGRAVETRLLAHVRETLRVLYGRTALLAVVPLLAAGIIVAIFNAVDQWWPLALSLGLVWYGPLNAALLGSSGLGGLLAGRIAGKTRLLWAVAGLGVAALAVLTVSHVWLMALGQCMVMMVFVALSTIYQGRLHDELPSRLRTSAASVVSSLTSLLFIPFLFVFGQTTQHTSVFTATWLLLPIGFVAVWGLYPNNPD